MNQGVEMSPIWESLDFILNLVSVDNSIRNDSSVEVSLPTCEETQGGLSRQWLLDVETRRSQKHSPAAIKPS